MPEGVLWCHGVCLWGKGEKWGELAVLAPLCVISVKKLLVVAGNPRAALAFLDGCEHFAPAFRVICADSASIGVKVDRKKASRMDSTEHGLHVIVRLEAG